jgi:phage terminase large subunit
LTVAYLSDTLDWSNPDYTEITKKRLIRLERIRSDPKVLAAHMKFYEQNHTHFIEDWMQTYDPRKTDWKYCPFILFPRQREYLHWLQDLIDDREDGVVDKSRDMGVTWLCVAKALCLWLFQPGVKIGIGSRKENLVDRIGDPDSIFEKFRLILRNLPHEFLPRGFDLEKNSPHMKLVNPENGAVIAGEAGDNIGRGGRSSIYFKDESAFYEHPERIEASLSQNSDVKIDVSTHSGPGTIFQQKCQSDAYRKFEFDWHDDPRKNQDWYDKQCELHDAVIIAREIDRNPDASIENICIPGHWVKASIRLGKLMTWHRPDQEGKAGLDVGGGSAESVFVPRFGSRAYMPICWKDPDSINIAGKSKDIAIENNIPLINYDSVGVGLGVTSAFRRLTGVKTNGINNGSSPSSFKWPDGKMSKDKFSNIKAEMWYLMRDAIRKAYLHYLYVTKHEKGVKQNLDEILLLPDDPKLTTQLSQPRTERTESGKIYIEKKSSLLKRGIKSPDRADALALTYVRVSTFTITDIDT